MTDEIVSHFDKSADAAREFGKEHAENVALAVSWIVECLKQGGRVLAFGNGGSAALAQHIAAEFINRMLFDRDPLPAIALTADSSVLTSIANDYSFAELFSKQIQALGRPGDIALGISTSGRSENVNRGLAAAGARGMKRIGLAGRPGSAMDKLVDLALNVSSDSVPCIQEVHLVISHVICELVEAEMFPGAKKPGAGK